MKKIKKRVSEYREAVGIMRREGVSLGSAKRFVKEGSFPPWPDEDSPTGWRQRCQWQGTCQYPCNGDC